MNSDWLDLPKIHTRNLEQFEVKKVLFVSVPKKRSQKHPSRRCRWKPSPLLNRGGFRRRRQIERHQHHRADADAATNAG